MEDIVKSKCILVVPSESFGCAEQTKSQKLKDILMASTDRVVKVKVKMCPGGEP